MKTILLRHKLLVAVALLVIGSGLVVSVVVSNQYGRSLRDALLLQGRYLCQALSSEAVDKILAGDLVSLKKLLSHHQSINPGIGYLFVVRDGEVLAHTFGNTFPVGLVQANPTTDTAAGGHQVTDIASEGRYLDFAWPVSEGRAGILRLGLSEDFIHKQVAALWVRMTLITLLVLLVSLVLSLLFVGRITRPLKVLVDAVEKVDADHLDIQTTIDSRDEVGVVAIAFNRMIARLRDYTRRLEAGAAELDRAYAQTRASFDILKKIGGQNSLKEVSTYLVDRFREIVPCTHLALMIFSPGGQSLHVYANHRMEISTRPGAGNLYSALNALEDITFLRKSDLPDNLLPASFSEAKRLAVFPFRHENQLLGALIIGCPGQCECNPKELEVIDLLLQETSAVFQRTVEHEVRLLGISRPEKEISEYLGIVGKDPQMRTLYGLIEDIAPSDATILIQGESGTGKELVARAVHLRSHRKAGPFVVINCSAYPASLLESELFGHEKGAFTGAIRQKAGRFEQADGGTVFLDEIGEIPASAQVKLLRILQTQKFERVGGEKTLSVDVRIISATNRNLLRRVKTGDFREDLFYRLNVLPIHLPPLRDRRNDIPLLARHFLARFAEEQGKSIHDFSQEAMAMMLAYDWPGNVREMENAVEHAVVLAKENRISVPDLPVALKEEKPSSADGKGGIMEETEIRVLHDVLETCDWNKKEAARRLGISRNTLYRKMKKYGIQPPTLH
ncbi:MAG: sigma 54-interacting transcriptional regulator [Desulfobacterales bacterium]